MKDRNRNDDRVASANMTGLKRSHPLRFSQDRQSHPFYQVLNRCRSLTLVYCVLALAGAVEPLKDPGLAVLGWLSMAILSVGMGMIFAIGTEYSEVAERFVQPIQYLMLPISGAFFMVAWLPKFAADLALYNPTVHCYEMFRAGFLGESVTTHYSPWYPITFGIVLIFFGLVSINSVRDNLHTG